MGEREEGREEGREGGKEGVDLENQRTLPFLPHTPVVWVALDDCPVPAAVLREPRSTELARGAISEWRA